MTHHYATATSFPIPKLNMLSAVVAACCTVMTLPSYAESVTTDAGSIDSKQVARFFQQKGYSPYAGRAYSTRPLWGELHLHTSWSADAIAAGTRVGPDEALRYAEGKEITSSTGQAVRLSRPYDWMMVADHSDAMGVMSAVLEGKSSLMTDPTLKRWHEGMQAGGEDASKVVMEIITLQGQGKLPEAMTDTKVQMDTWKDMTEIVESHNKPGTFTALIGYEWTSNYGGGNNLHRNIVYRDGKALADQVRPLTTFDTEIPNQLWDWMQGYEEKTGGQVLAVPHNGNLSNGLMFSTETPDGKPIDAKWAEARARWEPLYEVTQSKGTSEQHPSLAPADEFANFEIWDKGNLNVVPKEPGMIEREYAREALKNGLKLEEEFGTNPFKFGLVGSTDDHTGISSAEENNFFGKFPASEPSAERSTGNAFDFEGRTVKDWQLGASGLTAVWAEENTRASIWDAMKRKEVYATTGTRILVRFFGGWDFKPEDVLSRNPGAVGYGKGVPMGGDLTTPDNGAKAPSFLVAALKDSFSGNLDRIQIIKGWLDKAGKPQEKVYNVVWSGDRKLDKDGNLPSIGNTVDVANATWTNTIGSSELITVWQDPDFDPSLKAFYYARVIEIPTPRWTAYDKAYFADAKFSDEVPMTVTERAYTSPIWYIPSKQ
ncbi:DUF3604 domain-containing protein [Photobacterium ganghwense]|uniref:DUF3604 domain-containing protein n=1 Tax=Photobacterium ganghwense TaxID=320778 RepID=UPI001C2D9E67|nr:DUF3604 domain-containing protein [Photobacterium ganghwense]MBV1843212.1 DUF3604 domain-containing protein [Photobacterium ganghwense]